MLFLDIVGSTEIATDMGDERWRAALAEFRQIVRADLKRHRGHEEDTAGDGFFATFAQPAAAIRCAAAIANDVQSIGLDVRCGLHSGETGAVEGRPGGIAVHAAARVMALAGPAEILCTATVRDLVMGTDIGFEPRGTHELRGVPGTWDILVVRSTPEPSPTLSARRRPVSASNGSSPKGRVARVARSWARRQPCFAGIVALVLIIGHHSRATAFGPSASPPPALLRIDPDNSRVVDTVGARPSTENDVLGARDGSLWQGVNGDTLIRRGLKGGRELLTVKNTNLGFVPTFGFGSAWTYTALPGGRDTLLVTKYDEASGRPTPFEVPGLPMTVKWGNAFRAFVAGPNAPGQGVWYVNYLDKKLRVIDPSSDKTSAWSTGNWGKFGPEEVLPTADAVWLCDSTDHLIKRFNIKTHMVSRPIDTHGEGCPVAVVNGGLWVLDRSTLSLTEFNSRTLQQIGSPYGLGAAQGGTSIGLSDVGFGNLWFPSGTVVYRFNVTTHLTTPIPMPPGVGAGTVVADEPSRTVWVANCDPAWCGWEGTS